MYLVNYYYFNGDFAGFTYYDTLQAAKVAIERTGLIAKLLEIQD